jgi:uncharacterized protein
LTAVVVIAEAPGEGLADETAEAFRRHGGPVLVVRAGTRLTREQTDAALKQLDAGAEAVFGPSADGGYYVLALARPLPELFELGRDAWEGGRALELSLRAAWSRGVRTALIHPEHRVPLTASRHRRPPAIPFLVVGAVLWVVSRVLRAARGRD